MVLVVGGWRKREREKRGVIQGRRQGGRVNEEGREEGEVVREGDRGKEESVGEGVFVAYQAYEQAYIILLFPLSSAVCL